LNWNKRIRQVHRWLAIGVSLAVMANPVAMAPREPNIWVGLLALLQLVLLPVTGLYLFVLPYAARRRAGAQE
jgi:hypothetical protein